MSAVEVIDAFISSPGDCDEERRAIYSAAASFNRVAESAQGLRVNCFGPAQLYPTHGAYAQAGINRQLDDYELHVGLWRERFGMPTPAADSGSLEELQRALERRRSTRRPWVMCYFWQGAATDFRAVQQLLVNAGWYYHRYNDAEHLHDLFLNHLVGYTRADYRPAGHSSTLEGEATPAPAPHTVFQVASPGGPERRVSFDKAWVAVGRQPERNDIVLIDQRIHREHGHFVCRADGVRWFDLHAAVGSDGGTGQAVVIGEEVVLPDGTRIVLRALV